jgi:large subunit ribosomal protein L4
LQGSANTKTRAEVRGGGRKPIQQKGSGNARMGSKRSPLIPGGGVSFGPKPKDWSIKMNKKERRLAMGTALQSAAPDMKVVPDFSFIGADCKTRELVHGCAGLGIDLMSTYTLLITSDDNAAVERAGKNVARVTINKASALQVYDVLRADKIVVEESALELLSGRYQ